MRKFIFSFLILTFFAATMVCGCWHAAQAAAYDSHHSDGNNHHEQDAQFATNCSGTDMQLPGQISINKPALEKITYPDHQMAGQSIWAPALARNDDLYRPPPDWPGLSQTHPAILLITQRLLI